MQLIYFFHSKNLLVSLYINRFFIFNMFKSFSNILKRLSECIDSDDVLQLSNEMEDRYAYNDLIKIKKMLIGELNKNTSANNLHVNYLLNYLYLNDEAH